MSDTKKTNLFYLKIFLLVFAVFVIGSAVFKFANEIVQSRFRENSFYVLYVAKDSKYIYVDNNTKSTVYLSIGDIRKFVKGKGVLASSFSLGLPLNAMIIDENPPQNLSQFTTIGNLSRLIFDSRPVLKNMNRYDVYKLINSLNSTIEDNRKELTVDIFNKKEMKEKVGDSLKDSVIANTTYTIQINNGTSLNGLGSEFASILGRVGFNIIAVRTSEDIGNSYIAYPGEKNNFTNTLFGLSEFDMKKSKVSPASDVTIFLGEDVEAILSD